MFELSNSPSHGAAPPPGPRARLEGRLGRFLVVSDLHLADHEEHGDGWRYFKRRVYSPDRDLAALLRRFRAETGPGERPVLVLNGDVFDLDLVTAVPVSSGFRLSWLERRAGLSPTPAKAAWKLGRILESHRGFLDALVDHLASGGQVVHVLGNHDRELVFPEVRAVLTGALEASAEQRSLSFEADRLRFEPWFFHEPGVLYAEHGNQYDEYNAYRDALDPVVVRRGEPRISEPMGSLSSRCMLSAFGTFNPFAGDYVLGFRGYLSHWRRHYARAGRPYASAWIVGAFLVLCLLGRLKRLDSRRPPRGARLDEAAASSGLPESLLASLGALQARPAYERPLLVLRTLWYDRLLAASAIVLALALSALLPLPPYAQVAVPLLAAAAAVAYELRGRERMTFPVRERLPRAAAEVARLLRVAVVAMGHDHQPKTVGLGEGATFVDTGTWAPITAGGPESSLLPGYRNYAVVARERGGVVVRLASWGERARPVRELAPAGGPEVESSAVALAAPLVALAARSPAPPPPGR